MKAFQVSPSPGVHLFTPESRAIFRELGVLSSERFIGYVCWTELISQDENTNLVNGPFIQFITLDDEIEVTTIGCRVAPRRIDFDPIIP